MGTGSCIVTRAHVKSVPVYGQAHGRVHGDMHGDWCGKRCSRTVLTCTSTCASTPYLYSCRCFQRQCFPTVRSTCLAHGHKHVCTRVRTHVCTLTLICSRRLSFSEARGAASVTTSCVCVCRVVFLSRHVRTRAYRRVYRRVRGCITIQFVIHPHTRLYTSR